MKKYNKDWSLNMNLVEYKMDTDKKPSENKVTKFSNFLNKKNF